jgi:hypothetical protein
MGSTRPSHHVEVTTLQEGEDIMEKIDFAKKAAP